MMIILLFLGIYAAAPCFKKMHLVFYCHINIKRKKKSIISNIQASCVPHEKEKTYPWKITSFPFKTPPWEQAVSEPAEFVISLKEHGRVSENEVTDDSIQG